MRNIGQPNTADQISVEPITYTEYIWAVFIHFLLWPRGEICLCGEWTDLRSTIPYVCKWELFATYMMADGRIMAWQGREVVSQGIIGGKHNEMDVLGRRNAFSTSSPKSQHPSSNPKCFSLYCDAACVSGSPSLSCCPSPVSKSSSAIAWLLLH